MKIKLTLLALFRLVQLHAQVEPCDLNTIQTYAEVDSLVVPDEIYLSIITDEKDTKEQLDQLETQMYTALVEIGVNPKIQLSIDNFGSYNKSKLFGKEVKQRRKYELKVSTLEQAISSIGVLNNLDIGNVVLSRVDFSGKYNLMLELRSKAIIKAKSQAEAMVKPLDQRIGPAITIMDIDRKGIENLRSVMAGSYSEENLLLRQEKSKTTQLEIDEMLFTTTVFVNFKLLE